MKRTLIGIAFLVLGMCAACSDLAAQEVKKEQSPAAKPVERTPSAPKPADSPTLVDIALHGSAASGDRALNITGTNFKEGLSVVLTDPEGVSTKLPPEQIMSVKPTTISGRLKSPKAGNWNAQVTNPDGTSSNPLKFTVSGKPSITTVNPALLSVSSSQPLDFIGANFQNGLVITLINPSGQVSSLSGDDVVSIKPGEFFARATLGTSGRWKAIITNPGGEASDAFEFIVGRDSEAMVAYSNVFWVVTTLLISLMLLITITLVVYMAKGKWSLGDALSEEAAFQPKDITGRGNLIMVASSSRLIALLGLFGILTIVLGVGYSIIWNLFVNRSIPSLASVRSFLFGAATLFAPYLANQLRAAFDASQSEQPEEQPSRGEQESSGPETVVAVTGLIPHWPNAAPGNQPLTITGNGFQPGLVATLIDPRGVSHQVTPPPAADLHPTQVQVNAVLPMPGRWKATVTNPGADPSASFGFTVSGAPTIGALQPVTAGPNPQPLTFTGSGFMDGLAVSIRRTPPAPAPPLPDVHVDITAVSATEVKVSVILADTGQWQATVTNPGPRPATVAFTVNP